MTQPARPIRFVALTLLFWTIARVLVLWPDHDDPALPPTPRLASLHATPIATAHHGWMRAIPMEQPVARRPFPTPERPPRLAPPPARPDHPSPPWLLAAPPYLALLAPAANPALIPLAPPPSGSAASLRRLSAYGWAFWRNREGGSGLAESGQLGGSQAGLRLDYALGPDPAHGLRIGGRVSAPLTGRGREAAIGIGWKAELPLPAIVTIERRIGLDREARDAFAAGVASGISLAALPAGFRLEAYGQAGIVGLKRRDFYVDGAASTLRPVLSGNGISVSAGAGVWGAAQPGVSRLDVGPRIRTTITLGTTRIGAAIDWRQRIAGQARPRSGLALTLDGSF